VDELIAAVERALGRAEGRAVRVRTRAPLGGGCINRVERLETDAGAYVLKSNDKAPAELFEAEAAGLEALRAAGSPLVFPRVVATSAGADGAANVSTPAFIVLEHLRPGGRNAAFDEQLGTGLAVLHRATHSSFGFSRDTFCGSTRQANAWRTGWTEFYAAARLAPLVDRASRKGLLTVNDRRALDTLLPRLDNWIDEPAEGPALIHGDLWSGNLHVTTAGWPALLDPAAYYAHREAELGMMTLFGGFPARAFDAYHAAFPLEPGWRERNPLYQLYHVLNHVCLFGSSYLGQMRGIVAGFV
jgi:fructosamine-3-kinase